LKKVIFSFAFLIINFNIILAQEIEIAGKVFDINTYRAISYVNIYIKGTQIGTTTDFAGRFSLTVPRPSLKMILIFQHINYDIKEITLDKIKSPQNFYLQPRVIPLPEIEIEAKGEQLEIEKDLPQAVSVIKSSNFEIRGFVDAGDLLRTEQSIQVEEQLSGKKTISIRGGNPDDVVVLYNGVKMNSEYNYVFDFSLIDLENVERLEVIKGSNTALYGSEAFSGVVNIVPKVQQDYKIRFNQRIGSYDSGNWGLHLYHHYKNVHGSYQVRQGAARRMFADATDNTQFLENNAIHHTANIVYNFTERPGGIPKNSLGAMYVHSDLSYHNHRYNESLKNDNKMIGVRYSGDIYKLTNLSLSISQQWLDESISIVDSLNELDQDIDNRSLNIHAEKSLTFEDIELLGAYQFENSQLNLVDWQNNTAPGENNAAIHRERHGFVSIMKLHAPGGSPILKTVNFDISYRYDQVKDDFDNLILMSLNPYQVGGKEWKQSTVKFGAYFSGYRHNYAFDIFMNIGTNVKFPSLSQMISYHLYRNIKLDLKSEKNRSVEIGFSLKRDIREHPLIYGWQFNANYINNNYDNKFRPNYVVGIPYAYYDNVLDAGIKGFELKSSLYLLKKKMTLELGVSRYSIKEKSAFPFKSELKQTFALMIDHAGYAFQLYWFNEAEQEAWIHQFSGDFLGIILPGYSNIDVHLSKTFIIGKLKLFGNISLRNILDDKFELDEGLALRDRRYYLTVGVQY
jgi:outer membrane cobalamin receptor